MDALTLSCSAPATLSPPLKGAQGVGSELPGFIVRPQHDTLPLGPCQTFTTPEGVRRGWGPSSLASSSDPNDPASVDVPAITRDSECIHNCIIRSVQPAEK